MSLRKTNENRKYQMVSINNKNFSLHRLVLSSFAPIENMENYTVDHIDGNRSNNKLENLRWATNEENIAFMMINRKELHKELTRLLQNHSYNEILEMLKQLN